MQEIKLKAKRQQTDNLRLTNKRSCDLAGLPNGADHEHQGCKWVIKVVLAEAEFKYISLRLQDILRSYR